MMQQQIHGHEVMQMMINHDGAFTRESLRAAISERFGEQARFYTCCAENMTAEELVEFLQSRGKFVPKGEGFSTTPDSICGH